MKIRNLYYLLTILFVLSISGANAQTMEFTYQGRLTDGGMSPNANYDFQFVLYAIPSGIQVPFGIRDRLNVPVSNGAFSVTLDYGASPNLFTGAARLLEIAVKPAGGASYTTLNPRQPFTSAPYSIRSREAATADNSNRLGGMTAAQFVQTDAGGNVQIGGNLTVNGTLTQTIVNATTEYQIGGSRVLSAVNGNTFVGLSTGGGGVENTFIGNFAGQMNTTGVANTFVGAFSGLTNTLGRRNSFFGMNAGRNNLSGNANSFFGYASGSANTTGVSNAFFGDGAATRTRAAALIRFSERQPDSTIRPDRKTFFSAPPPDLITRATATFSSEGAPG